jgi:hypothetical protein
MKVSGQYVLLEYRGYIKEQVISVMGFNSNKLMSMKHKLEQDFIEICQEIKLENRTVDQWVVVESDGMFQKGKYVGGFDSIEMEFTFSLYEDEKEYWFQLALNDIYEVADGKEMTVEVIEANY